MTIEVTADETRLAALCVLAQRTRELMDAVAVTDVGEDELAAVTAELTALTERLNAARRTSPQPFEIGPGGTVRHLGNAVTGAANPYAPPLVIEAPPEGGVRAEVTFRPLHEGPPGAVHGGVSAMMLDHLLGQAVAVAGFAGLTGTLTIRYRAPVPYGRPLVASAEYDRSEGRKAWANGRIALPDGTPLVEATGLFIVPTAWLDREVTDVPRIGPGDVGWPALAAG
ncbi:PaaI family thioesterase [Nonomuraea sp. NPDC048916]|uniref:PaaI family thioesterase n=1 Tax=Nonomuraea sp. NPDC048916 TaxID=3154232 RepID=UPI0033E0DDF3